MLEVEFDENSMTILLNNPGTATNEKAQSTNVQLEEFNKGRMDATEGALVAGEGAELDAAGALDAGNEPFEAGADVTGIPVMAAPAMAAASKPADIVVSELDESLKPPVTIARGAPRVSPVRVMMMADVLVAAPAVVRTIAVLVAVAAGDEVAVKPETVLAMEVTDPKK